MNQRKTILVVDDEVKITEIVKSYLENSGYNAICAHDADSALSLFDQHEPALVILDLMLPGMPGEDICRIIRKKSRVPIIMLTAKTSEESILEGLGIGADDYVVKPFSPRQLMARVEAVLRRASNEALPLSNALIFNGGDLVIDGIRHEVRKQGKRVQLTPNEFNILFSMAKYPTKTFTRDELITLAMGDTYDGFDRVIDTHIKNIRQKIEDQPRNAKYIKTVHGIGYSFGGE